MTRRTSVENKKNSGYMPNKEVRKRISIWEGSSMYKPAPDTGKINNSFENEARGFYNVLPKKVKDFLSTPALDALYSTSYNIGCGNFKNRVVPHLVALVDAYEAGSPDLEKYIDRVTTSMFGKKDNQQLGLANRRAFEREAFRTSMLNQLGYTDSVFNWNMPWEQVYGYRSKKGIINNNRDYITMKKTPTSRPIAPTMLNYVPEMTIPQETIAPTYSNPTAPIEEIFSNNTLEFPYSSFPYPQQSYVDNMQNDIKNQIIGNMLGNTSGNLNLLNTQNNQQQQFGSQNVFDIINKYYNR